MVLLPPSQHVVIILAILLITGCAGIKPPPTIIFQNDPYLVRLDIDRSVKGPNDPRRYTHPIDIEAGQIHTILDSARVSEHRTFFQHAFMAPSPQVKIFSDHNIRILASHIHEAFLQATPQERVIFALINQVGTRYEITAGEIFVKKNMLHLTLNCFQTLDADNGPNSLCGSTYVSPHPSAIRHRTYDLSFTKQKYFAGFGKQSFGQAKKEIIIDYSSIPASDTLLSKSVPREEPSSSDQLAPMDTNLQKTQPIHLPAVSTPPSLLEQMPSQEIQLSYLEQEDFPGNASDHATNVENNPLQTTLEQKIELLTQAIHSQGKAVKQHAPPQKPRILFLQTPLMRGKDVALLQRALGLPLNRIDGIFGKETDRAVRKFQHQAGIAVDGKVGPNTLNVLQ
tara:strand:- start:19686 stop:20873 length:1188 start_codon:yes stop_codon:yes gene_type:complete